MKQKPKLGQNFLVDPAACIAIADALGDISRATVVEIGPGAGAITQILAPRAHRLIVIELDRALAAGIRARFPAVEVLAADVLAVDFSALRAHGEKLRVAGNLPYYITSPILLHLFRYAEDIDSAVIMTQREVAGRLLAAPGSSDYGALSATARLYADVARIVTLPPQAFMPPPEVHSTVLRLTLRPRFAELGVPPDAFLPFLRHSFAQKRKTLGKNLRAAGYSAAIIPAALQASAIPPTARAEEIDLDRMAALWKALHPPQR